MAAPPSKPSPSNQAVQRSSSSSSPTQSANDATGSSGLKVPPPPYSSCVATAGGSGSPSPSSGQGSDALSSATAMATSSSPINVIGLPTYESSESSDDYLMAKELLNAGSFEEALGVIEHAIETTKALLLSSSSRSSNDDDESRAVDLHESIAPLHYLYGTTLLYSLEEARDDGTGGEATNMTVLPAGVSEPSATGPFGETGDVAAPHSATMPECAPAVAAAATNPWAHLPSSSEGMAATEPQDEEDGNNDGNDDAEDIQIAWENLEAARTIVEGMLTRPDLGGPRMAKLQLDLAQILLREGDLQRLNGRYASAIQDYTSCLELRQSLLDPWDRKIADTQFNLALTYMSNSSELQKELAGGTNRPEEGEGVSSASTPNAAALAKEHSKKGIEMQVQCARTLCGIIARLCGVEPEQLVEQTSSNLGALSSSKPAAGFKTTGLDDEDNVISTAIASQTVNVWRKKVASLVASSQTPDDTSSANQVYDIQQVLDEIQETIDEAERSQDAIRQAVEIRTQAQKAAELNAADTEVTSLEGVTTSIGFGAAPAATLTAVATNSAQATTLSNGKPMMVIKKKKKRKECDEEGEDSKPAAVPFDGNVNKRARSEE